MNIQKTEPVITAQQKERREKIIASEGIVNNKLTGMAFSLNHIISIDGGKMYASYFSEQLQELKQEYREYIYNSDFYRYYRSRRTDRDETYFRLGNINFHGGLNSFVFETATGY